MVVERVHDSEHSIIDVIHIQSKGIIESVAISEEELFDYEIESVKKELAEDFPDYTLVFATRSNKYIKDEFLGEIMRFCARCVKYFNLT